MNVSIDHYQSLLREHLRKGRTLWGAALPDPSPLLAKLTIDTGVDFLWIDTEHRPYGTEAISMIPVLCRRKGCAPVIRVAGLESSLIKKALDIGAVGIMVPQISTADEARKAVAYAHYPPQGTRGVSPSWTTFLDVPLKTYLAYANEETCVVVQIESPDGIRNLESIAEVPGVDVLFAGPMDLSASLGHIGEVNDPHVQEFLREFPQRVAQCGKPSGIAVSNAEEGRKAWDQGYRFINIGHIIGHGFVALKGGIDTLRKLPP
jgi:2-keto-3-deoxy-L-rhamnonate aldolase RhmA